MQKIIKKQIGQETHTFVVEGETFYDVMREAGKLSFNNVYKCGCCGSDKLYLGSHKAKKKFEYITITCGECKSFINFGKQVEDPTIFYLRTREENGKKVLDWTPFEKGND